MFDAIDYMNIIWLDRIKNDIYLKHVITYTYE